MLLSCVSTLHTVDGLSSSSSSSSSRQRLVDTPHNPPSTYTQKKKTLTLLTFDLDDTLFPVGPVVQDANVAMFDTMAKLGFEDATEEGYLSACRAIRKENYQPDSTNPITYSELRRRAVLREVQRCRANNNNSNGSTISSTSSITLSDTAIVEQSFRAWLTERHASAERHLFPHAIPMLEAVRTNHPHTCIGAVTNGRGSPMDMKETLRPYFDFCVSGEDDDVFPNRKPHRAIFDTAMERASSSSSSNENEQHVHDGCWIHVGDDLANDVGASAKCGAKAVWMDVETYLERYSSTTTHGKQSFVSTASEEEQERRRRLAEKAMVHVTAKIETLADLPTIIDEILSQ